VQIGRHKVRYGPMGPDQATVAAAKAGTLTPLPPLGNRATWMGWGMVAGACVLVVASIAAGAAALGVMLGLVVGGIGAWQLYETRRARNTRQYEEERRQSAWRKLEEEISQVQTALAELRAQATGAAEEATAARSGFDEQVAALSR
jgi:hypothetical protein